MTDNKKESPKPDPVKPPEFEKRYEPKEVTIYIGERFMKYVVGQGTPKVLRIKISEPNEELAIVILTEQKGILTFQGMPFQAYCEKA